MGLPTLVELSGIEPLAFPARRDALGWITALNRIQSIHSWTVDGTSNFGGAERDRTAGLLVANEALSQLSYSPTT
jgi:hypothetical protein